MSIESDLPSGRCKCGRPFILQYIGGRGVKKCIVCDVEREKQSGLISTAKDPGLADYKQIVNSLGYIELVEKTDPRPVATAEQLASAKVAKSEVEKGIQVVREKLAEGTLVVTQPKTNVVKMSRKLVDFLLEDEDVEVVLTDDQAKRILDGIGGLETPPKMSDARKIIKVQDALEQKLGGNI